MHDLYGLAAGGEAGVARVLTILRSEIERGMALMGRVRVADITAADIKHLSEFGTYNAAVPVLQARARKELDQDC